LQFAANQGHEFLLSETELDLWRGDILKTIKVSVRLGFESKFCAINDIATLGIGMIASANGIVASANGNTFYWS
jgi:hypothetical protein